MAMAFVSSPGGVASYNACLHGPHRARPIVGEQLLSSHSRSGSHLAMVFSVSVAGAVGNAARRKLLVYKRGCRTRGIMATHGRFSPKTLVARCARGGETSEPDSGTNQAKLFERTLQESSFAFSEFGQHFMEFLQQERLGPLQEITGTPPELLAQEAPSKEGSAKVATMLFKGIGSQSRVRRVRVTVVDAGKQVQAFNAAVYPSDKSELPVLGCDLILIQGTRLLVGMDFSPLSRDPEYLRAYCEKTLGPIREKYDAYDGLITAPGSRFYGEDPEFFSPALFFSRAEISNLASGGPLIEAFKEICDAFADLLSGVELTQPISLRTPGEVRWQHTRYDAWHKPRDPAVGMFNRMYGKEWTERFVNNVLFPWAKTLTRRSGPLQNGQRSILAEMRKESMKMHTVSQAPKHGQAPEKRVPMSQRQVTKESMLQYLVDSQVAYEAFEATAAAHDALAGLRDTGLERVELLREDIAGIASREQLEVPKASGTATEYAKFLHELAASDTPRYICHWYNHHFAHTAGGRMIYAMARKKVFGEDGGPSLGFWEKYPKAGASNDYQELLVAARARVEECARSWSKDSRQACTQETSLAFEKSGGLMKSLFVEDPA